MSDLIEIMVICHFDNKGDEYPVYFYWDNICFKIRDILDHWYQGELNPDMPPANYFKVRISDDKIFILKNDSIKDVWFLWIHGESLR